MRNASLENECSREPNATLIRLAGSFSLERSFRASPGYARFEKRGRGGGENDLRRFNALAARAIATERATDCANPTRALAAACRSLSLLSR